jgi:maltokinase
MTPTEATPKRSSTTLKGDPALAGLVLSYAARRPGWAASAGHVAIVDDEVIVPGRPGVRDVVAEVGGTLVHLPVGLRSPGDEIKVLAGVEEPSLGLYDGSDGLAVAFDAVRDADTASLLLHAVTGRTIEPERVRQVRFDTSSATLAFDDRLDFTIFDRLVGGPHPGLELLVGLDAAGFNHVAPPVAVWRRGGRDLGVVQEHLAGGSSGWAMARTSVRDLYAARVSAEDAGGDFASEARRLGTMTARMHLALAEAFGSRREKISSITSSVESHVAEVARPLLERTDVAELLVALQSSEESCAIVRAHGDFHLGRVWRAEQGWMVVELTPGEHPVNRPGGVPGDADLDADVGPGPTERSPLADVADMLWSFGQVASVAAARRDPSGRENLGPLAHEWGRRNRLAFMVGYQGVPGIAELIPRAHEDVQRLTGLFELDRAAGRLARRRDD